MTRTEIESLIEERESAWAWCEECRTQNLIDELYVDEHDESFIWGQCTDCGNTTQVELKDLEHEGKSF
jgi:hypothetical protein